ncbi:alginate lyase [Cryptococcus deuterogattii R265]|uniref:Alginate lyase n=1 Tax=Cryptococcus deuterogattii (strain R265) TaxID=294750 RepID=A0A095C8L9_CRYD2|nr:alginate lyase [Cryptococcus deuterogattii R265]KIR29121.1 alginate lyase [Cryptococcus deuterogattii LA55]KIR71656.1 alginate lyase [Cryptococcus deuterogattii CA1014]KIR91239.1 alginate lyase [Cryptococcus deuterogattii CBS 10090]KIR98572.1 alginate lyase [Cryptococcus deuterogattii 2001/935-1]
MLRSIIAVLPILASLPLSSGYAVSDDVALESRSWYERAADALSSRADAAQGHSGLRSRAHTSGLRRRASRHYNEAGQKLVRRKKETTQERDGEKKKKKKRSCKAKTTGLGAAATAASSSVSEEAASSTAILSGSLGTVANAATAGVNSQAESSVVSSSSSDAAHVTNYAPTTTSSAESSTITYSASAVADALSPEISVSLSVSAAISINTSIDILTTYTVPDSATTAFTSAASASASTTSSATNSPTSELSSDLLPWGHGISSWTTSDGLLSYDAALKPLTAGKLPSVGNAPDGISALQASYPAGSYGLTNSGFSFYTAGDHSGVEVDNASEVALSYSVFFEEGFGFNKGGKMPGLYGGTSLSEAKSCSGGRQTDRESCFSARLMWRTEGAGEIYDYLPVSYTGTDDGYGESIDRGAFTWATGRWQTVAIRVKLNDVGQANGEQELIVDGESKINITGVTFATEAGTRIYGIMAQTFFGGHTSDWASPKDQSLYFKDWTLTAIA